MSENCFKNRRQIDWFITKRSECIPIFCTCINNVKVRLFISRSELNKQIKKHINNLFWSSCWFVNLIQDHYRFQSKFERFFQNKFGLWHRSLIRVNNEQNTIYHTQNAFYFRSEVSMSWCVNNIDCFFLITNRSIFRINCNTSFAFLIITIHH